MAEPILVAKSPEDLELLPKMANRHGLVAGATGTGKTVTLQKLAEGFSRIGVPVFLADVKGDLSGLCKPGTPKPPIAERIALLEITDFEYCAFPVAFWDVFGERGHPVRATISEMGPLLLSRLLNLNDTQAGVLQIAFKVADDNGLLLLDLKDLKAMLQYVGDNSKDLKTEYGNISPASVGAIQRGLLVLSEQGGESFFGEPALDLMDFIQNDAKGHGVINVLAADKLLLSPQLYATFLLWMLAELFERLPEVGDLDKPKLVFFFDEAHLLFTDAPKSLLEKIEQVVRLIRSKGVGIYFVTQNPLDIPETVLAQLGNRVQHALRAFTPRDQKAVRTAAETFRTNPNLDTASVITQLAVGEALISFLDAKGTPTMVQHGRVIPPSGQIGPITDAERLAVMKSSVVFGVYEKIVDRESAYEILRGRADGTAPPAESGNSEADMQAKRDEFAKKQAEQVAAKSATKAPGRRTDSIFITFCKSAVRTVATSVGRVITRGIFDVILGGGKKR